MSRLYVVEFSSGHIKVGRSNDIDSRIDALKRRVACLGVSIMRWSHAECASWPASAELALINWCAERATKRHQSEWFDGIGYDLVVSAMHGIAGNHVDYRPKASVSKLRSWLDAERGRAKALADRLGVTKSAISQAADGIVRVPPSWYAVVRDFTSGQVSIEDLLPPTKAAA